MSLRVARTRLMDSVRLAEERIAATVARPHDCPIFIFGNQKSGTSAISALLARATGTRLQLDFRGAREPYLTPLLNGQIDLDGYIRRNAYAFSAPMIKEPGLTFIANRLAERYPNSPCVFIVRNPFDNIRSILNRLKLRGDLRPDEVNLRALPNSTWRAVVSGGDLNLSGSYVEIQARRWNRAVDEYRKASGRFVLVRYEDFNIAKQDVIADLAERLGLTVRHSIVDVMDRAFQPRGYASVDLLSFFGPTNTARIADICADGLNLFGYTAPQTS